MPVGVIPSTPVTVTPSVSELPSTTVPVVGELVTAGVTLMTVKHSRVVDPSDPPK